MPMLDMQNLKEARTYLSEWVDTTKSHADSPRLMSVLWGTMIALVVADGLISRFLVTTGLAREGNPLLQVWIHDDLFLGIKLAGAFFAALALWSIHKSHPNLSFIITLCFVVFYTGLVFWSLLIFWGSHV